MLNNSKYNALIPSAQRGATNTEQVSLLPICLGQEYHEGEKLQALIKLLQSSKKIIVLISEVLYRHTMQLTSNLNPIEAYEKTVILSEEWYQRNKKVLELSEKPVIVYNWKDWLMHPNYDHVRIKVEKSIMKHEDLKVLIKKEALEFVDKLESKGILSNAKEESQHGVKSLTKEKQLLRCIEYLMEECAMFILMHEHSKDEYRYTELVYPGSSLNIVKAMFKHYNLNIPTIHPTFSSKVNKSLIYVPQTSKSANEVRDKILSLEQGFNDFSDYYTVHESCKIFLLKKASEPVREKAARFIESCIANTQNLFDTFKESDDTKNITILIFSPKDSGYNDKFTSGQWKKYLPIHKIEMIKDIDCLANLLHKSGIISLDCLGKREQQKHILPGKSLSTWQYGGGALNSKFTIFYDIGSDYAVGDIHTRNNREDKFTLKKYNDCRFSTIPSKKGYACKSYEKVWLVNDRTLISSGDNTGTSTPEDPSIYFPYNSRRANGASSLNFLSSATTAAVLMGAEIQLRMIEMEDEISKHLASEVPYKIKEITLTPFVHDNHKSLDFIQSIGIYTYSQPSGAKFVLPTPPLLFMAPSTNKTNGNYSTMLYSKKIGIWDAIPNCPAKYMLN